jgi:signal transduction histidine kinase
MRFDSPEAKRAEMVLSRSRALRTQCRSLVARAKTLVNDVPPFNRTSLSERVVRAQEDERRRIARDIHDQLGQQITALRLNLDELQNRPVGHRWSVDSTKRLSRLAEELDKSMDMLVAELRPAALEQLGLAAGLKELVATWSTCFKIPAHFRTRGIGEQVRLPREVEINLYRISQEALHNVQKHSGATQVTVLLERRGPDVVLIVEDNGCGFNLQRLNGRRGLGMVSMHERAETIGGRLDIDSRVGTGASVAIRVPADLRAVTEQPFANY